MRRFSSASDRFFEPIQIVGGPRTRAIIQRPSETDKPNREMSGTRTAMRVRKNSVVRTGDVIKVGDDEHFLVAAHSTIGDNRLHRLFVCERLVHWERMQETIDPLTKRPKATSKVTIGNVWMVWGLITREPIDLTIRISDQKNTVLTGEDVRLGDILDGQIVKRINTALGIKAIEVQ